ncbi:MAG: WD40 repeat domain-containing protein [Ferruginibacter sp.]
MKKTTSFLVLILLVSAYSNAQTTPVLNIETGMHTLVSRRIASDAAGKYLLTCSDDKTARLWDTENGDLLKTFRIPVTNETGKLYACSISPDGKMIALGGETDYETKGSYSVYILNAQTAEITYTINELTAAINDLSFSLDGKYLAVGFWGEKGINIYNTETWTLKKNLSGYNGTVHCMRFNPATKEFASLSYDGMLRLYDKTFNLINSTDCNEDKGPISIAYNEKGNLLAVAYNQNIAAEVRDAGSLNLLYNTPIDDIERFNGKILQFCFSKTGDILSGGGDFHGVRRGDGYYEVRTWQNYGKTFYKDNALFSGSINGMIALPKNRIAVVTDHPEVAVMNDTGTIVWRNCTEKLSDIKESDFRINDTGNEIAIEITGNVSAIKFNISDRDLSYISPEKTLLQQPSKDKAGTTVTNNWGNIDKPVINGNKLLYYFGSYEVSKCADVSNDGKTVCIGTNRALYLFTKDGDQLWKIPLTINIQAINISGNSKVIAAAFNDGTIKWFSMKNGKELLTLFLNADKTQWVLFTPAGYYDTSPGSESYLGWYIDNGPDKAPTFNPASTFRKEYRRPDIIDKVLKNEL